MRIYHSKHGLLPGTTYTEVLANARIEFSTIRSTTKRQPYIRSKYFHGDKIFMAVFWNHIMQKHLKDRTKRLRFYRSAADLLRHSTLTPDTVFSKEEKNIMLHRFYGSTPDGIEFCVQVKENVSSGRKDFMSVFDRKYRK